MSRRLPRFTPPLTWMLVVGVASVTRVPGHTGAGLGSGIPVDLAFHVLGYVILAVLLVRAELPVRLAVVVTVSFGAGIEVVQGLLPYRSLSAIDALVNLLGAVSGAALMRWRRRVADASLGG